MSGRGAPSGDRGPRHGLGLGRRGARDPDGADPERRPPPPRDRADVSVRRPRDLGPRAREPDGRADDRGRARPGSSGRSPSRRSRSSTRSAWRSRTPRSSSSSPSSSPTRAAGLNAGRSGRGRDPGGRRDRPQRPLLDEPARSIADRPPGCTAVSHSRRWRPSVIVRRWLIAPPRARRELLPVLVAGLVFLIDARSSTSSAASPTSPTTSAAVLVAASDLAPAAIPVALLIGFYRQSERRLRAVVDAIPDRMVRFDRDGGYLDVRGGRRRRRRRPVDARRPVGQRLHEAMFGGAADTALAVGGRPSTRAGSSRSTSRSTCRVAVASSRHGSRRAAPTR